MTGGWLSDAGLGANHHENDRRWQQLYRHIPWSSRDLWLCCWNRLCPHPFRCRSFSDSGDLHIHAEDNRERHRRYPCHSGCHAGTPDYLAFGYWVQTRTTSRGETRYGVNTFATGSLPFGTNPDDANNAEIAALEGSATYEGPATGMYAYKTASIEDGKVVRTPSAAGQFTADVELTATFGAGPSVADDDAFDISGTASNFQDADGDMIDSDWSLDLNTASFGTESGGTITDATNTFTGTTGEGSTMGQWSGQFFGEPGTGDAASSTHPTGVAGKFTGHFENGHVIGAFGATEQ